jgi:hypothetical protein
MVRGAKPLAVIFAIAASIAIPALPRARGAGVSFVDGAGVSLTVRRT